MSYREHAPPPELAPWLACTWEREGSEGVPVRVVPDGCVDVVWTERFGTHVVGANTTAFVVSLAEGTRVAGVRIRPGAAPPLLGVTAEEVVDARPPVDALWGDAGRRLAADLDAAEERVATLLRALAARARPPDPLVAAAVARLDAPGAVVADLAGDLGVSERQLRRRVAAAVGYGPKRLARVLRLQRALGAARAGHELARVAFDAGYADQAHFANECSALAGVPPSALV
ncbi:MAG TPA: helix-turn-helix transcriptional regulator [Solirubrobacteraceae bacterium]|nr:helix-turn-helix transcriptional regulator [Solirubrobacteraceae bacterium]